MIALGRGTELLAQRDRLGGALTTASAPFAAIAPPDGGGPGVLVVAASRRVLGAVVSAAVRGAPVLVDAALAPSLDAALAAAGVADAPRLVHPHASWALAELLDDARPAAPPAVAASARVHPTAVLYPGVVLADDVVVEAGAVLGAPGFGFVASVPAGARPRVVPQPGGVRVERGAYVGPLCTVASGTLGPTVVGEGVRLDAQVHVGHNVLIGEGTQVAAQSGFAGSVRLGRGVLVGGQVGVADHVTVGDGARIAAKSGVTSDVPPGATYGGYPAVPRGRWLRALAAMYRAGERR